MSEEIQHEIDSLSDEALLRILSSTTLWTDTTVIASDNESTLSSIPYGSKDDAVGLNREELQKHCWSKFVENPQVNTAIRGIVGRITGLGFDVTSEVPEIQKVITETITDFRNKLYMNWTKNIGRSFIEGELHICFTVHENGFVETDFIDPSTITDSSVDDGIIYHPRKTLMPLIYCIDLSQGTKDSGYTDYTDRYQIPSINVARDPNLLLEAKRHNGYNEDYIRTSMNDSPAFKSIGGFYRFIVSWDRSFYSRRNVSYLRTVLKWLNHYEQLKLYEIDHKKSAGSFLWSITSDSWKNYRMFLGLSDEEKRKTGLGSKMTPGERIFLPPGVTIEAKAPQLPIISETDTDILHMVTSGLNEPEDVSTGQSKGTFASVKASRGPMSDRVSDEIAEHDRFFRYDFWGGIFFLKSKVSNFKSSFSVDEVISFGKDGKPVEGKVEKKPEELISISYPVSSLIDLEGGAKTWLGTKHGSTNDTLGISNETIARKLGIQNYHRERLKSETEKIKYPELIMTIDAESAQEQQEAEPSPSKIVRRNREPQKKEPRS